MRKTIVLNSDEMFTLFLISKLNNDLLTNGLTKENIDRAGATSVIAW